MVIFSVHQSLNAMNENQNHDISLTEAAELTRNYRNASASIVVSALSGLKAEAFGKQAILSVLNQNGCTGIRFYFGLESLPPAFTLVAVGVDLNGNDILPGVILEHANRCPPICGALNELNAG